MGDRKRTAESNVSPFMWPVIMAPEALKKLRDGMMGPGEPDPEDDWKVPAGPLDAIEGQGGATPEPARSGRAVGLLQRVKRTRRSI
jgi:hypothetical protein